MPDLSERLASCFAAVFPDLAAEDIATASVESVDGWDSLAAVTLLALVEEEFDTEFPLNVVADLSSFDHFRTLLQGTREFVGGPP